MGDQRSLLIGAEAAASLAEVVVNHSLTASAAESPPGLEALEPPMIDPGVIEALPSAMDALRAADRGDGVLVAPDDRLASLLQSFLAERGVADFARLDAEGKLRPVPDDGLEAIFDAHDIAGWALHFLPEWLAGRFSKRPFLPPTEKVGVIPDNARIAILGDWGTGMYGAPVAAATIAQARPAYDAVVHLGDVYYAGTTSEITKRFLDVWPKVPNASNWALNSNHEMYSGGEGYFDHTLKDPRFAQGSSLCAFQTAHLLFLGLDTGYQDDDLSIEQVEWIRRRIAAAGTRRIVLLSHHQPFSQYESGGTNIVAKLRDLLASGRVTSWYWGHEHRCAIYDRYAPWSMSGRCIGHSGYPAFRDRFSGAPEHTNPDGSTWWHVKRNDWPRGQVLDGLNPYVEGHAAHYSPNGYLSLELDGPTIRETVRSPDGTVLLTNTVSG